MYTCMLVNIEEVNGASGEESWGMRATKGKHAAVMVGVGMSVEEIGGNSRAQFG